MSNQVVIEKYRDEAAVPERLSGRINAIADEIRQRAFGFFERQGCRHGSDLEDWLRAEREVIASPAADLVERDDSFQVRVAMPGFDAAAMRVSATPSSLIIEADARHAHDESQGAVHFCEFSDKSLFRQVNLPAGIDLDKLTASLDKGILRINAPKAAKQKQAGAGSAA